MKTYITYAEWRRFKHWLVYIVGVGVEPPANEYELLRWKHLQPSRPKPIAFRRDVSDKVTLNGEAARFYDDYKRRHDHVGNVH